MSLKVKTMLSKINDVLTATSALLLTVVSLVRAFSARRKKRKDDGK